MGIRSLGGELMNMSRGHTDDPAGRTPVGRRALLKAVAAGGAFAVPLIASFSMDATAAKASPHQPMSGNMGGFMQSCANQATYAPSGLFFVTLVTANTNGPTRGYAEIEVDGSQDELSYEIGLSANVHSPVAAFIITATDGSFVFKLPSGTSGTIPGSNLACSNGAHPPAGLADLYELMRAGQATARVQLHNGTQLTGRIGYL